MPYSRIAVLPLLVLMAASLPSCDGSPEEPVPPADIHFDLPRIFPQCTDPAGCDWPGRVTNNGPGCARDVHGTVRLEGDPGAILTFEWTLPGNPVMRPSDVIDFTVYHTDFGTEIPANGATTRVFWSDVRC